MGNFASLLIVNFSDAKISGFYMEKAGKLFLQGMCAEKDSGKLAQ